MALVSLTDLRSVFVFLVVFMFRLSSINKEISLSSRSLLVSTNSFSLKTSKFGKHSLFSLGKNERFGHFFIVHLVSLMPDVKENLVENLSNRSSGVQIPWDICTRFGCYLYSTECS